MAITFFTQSESWSGAEVHTLALCQTLVDIGYSVTVVEMGQELLAPYAPQCGFRTIPLGSLTSSSDPSEPRSFREWSKTLSNINDDVGILVKGAPSYGSLIFDMAMRVNFHDYITIEHMRSPLPKRPKISLGRNLIPSLGFWWYLKRFNAFARSLFPTMTVCVSTAVAATLQQDHLYAPSKLQVCHSGVHTNTFKPCLDSRHETRIELGIDQDSFVIGTIGRLSPMKNQAMLIEAFARWRKRKPGVKANLVIVGEGPREAKLKQLATDLNVEREVVFAGFSDKPQNIYPALDTFCLTSSDEALGISLLEAMACGVPSIGTKVGGVPEVIDVEGSFLVAPHDTQTLSNKIDYIQSQPHEEKARLQRSVRGHIEDRFEAKSCFQTLADLVTRRAPSINC